MRISDWSSDVCSSDLFLASFLPRELFGKMMRRLFPDRHLAATDPAVVKHGPASGHDSDDVGEHGARRGPNGFPPVIELACEYRSEEHTSALQSLMRNTYAVLCLLKNSSTNLRMNKTN